MAQEGISRLPKSTCRKWCCSDLRRDTSQILPIASWLSLHGKPRGRRCNSGGWGCVWSPESATLVDSLVTQSQRRLGYTRGWQGGPTWWRCWKGWRADISRQHTQVCRIPSRRSEILSSASPQTLFLKIFKTGVNNVISSLVSYFYIDTKFHLNTSMSLNC